MMMTMLIYMLRKWRERRIRTANGGHENVIGDSDISVARVRVVACWDGVREGCGREWREGRECGGRGSGCEVRRVVGTCGTNLKPIDVHNATQKIVVRDIKRKEASTNL